MFLSVFVHLADRLAGGLPNAISNLYGINSRELRMATAASSTVLARIRRRRSQALEKERISLRSLGADDDYITRLQSTRPLQADGAPAGIATLVHDLSQLSMFDCPATIRHALAMDRVIARWFEPGVRADPDALIEVCLDENELRCPDWSWIKLPEVAERIDRAAAAPMGLPADDRARLNDALQSWAWLRLLALWDMEMMSSFWQYAPDESKRCLPSGSSFALLLPRETDDAKGQQLPASRLLDLTWARLQHLARGRWPSRAPHRHELVAACASWEVKGAERKIKGVRSGEKMIDLPMFMELFTAMREAADLPRMPIPLPWLVAALLWEKACVKLDARREHPVVRPIPDPYSYQAVWELERLRTAPRPALKASAWPAWLGVY